MFRLMEVPAARDELKPFFELVSWNYFNPKATLVTNSFLPLVAAEAAKKRPSFVRTALKHCGFNSFSGFFMLFQLNRTVSETCYSANRNLSDRA